MSPVKSQTKSFRVIWHGAAWSVGSAVIYHMEYGMVDTWLYVIVVNVKASS